MGVGRVTLTGGHGNEQFDVFMVKGSHSYYADFLQTTTERTQNTTTYQKKHPRNANKECHEAENTVKSGIDNNYHFCMLFLISDISNF